MIRTPTEPRGRPEEVALTLRTIGLTGPKSAELRGERSTGHWEEWERALVMHSLQNVCWHVKVVIGSVNGALEQGQGRAPHISKKGWCAYLQMQQSRLVLGVST